MAMARFATIIRVDDVEKAGDKAADAMDQLADMKTAMRQTTPKPRPTLTDRDIEAQMMSTMPERTHKQPVGDEMHPLLGATVAKTAEPSFDDYAKEHLFVRQAMAPFMQTS